MPTAGVQIRASQDRLGPDGDSADTVPLLLTTPERGLYGIRADEQIYRTVSDVAISFEDRLKLTKNFAVIGGLRYDHIDLWGSRYDIDGTLEAKKGYPFSKDFNPVTGRIGYTWEVLPGLVLYSQYATAADPAVSNIFRIKPLIDKLELTTTRTYETGAKYLSPDKRFEATFSAYDIERANVYENKAGGKTAVAAKVHAQGVEFAAAYRPTDAFKMFANIAYVESTYKNFTDASTGEIFDGKTVPNVPRVVANAGASYRFLTPWPVEVGGLVRYVGARFNNDDNLLIMDAYTVGDVFAIIDIDSKDFMPLRGVNKTQVTLRIKNVTDRRYAVWGDAQYPDQVLLGVPRTYEFSTAFKF